MNQLPPNSPHYLVKRYFDDTDYTKIEKATEDMRFVYLVANPITKLCKVGITNNRKTRFAQIQNASGMQILELITLELEIGYDEQAKYIEKYLHTFFDNKRKFGEWFELSLKDIFAIRDLFVEIWGDYLYYDDFKNNLKKMYETNTTK